MGIQIAQQTGIELLFVESRLKVNAYLHPVPCGQLFYRPPAQCKYYGAAKAIVFKHKLAELHGTFSAVNPNHRIHILQCQSLQPPGNIPACYQWYQRRPYFAYGMSCLPGQFISVSRRSRSRV